MKVSKEVINKFREMCMNEQDTNTEDVRFKIVRDFSLGSFVCSNGEDDVTRAFGTLHIRRQKGVIVDIYRGGYYPVNKKEKKAYTYCHRMGWI